MKKGMKEGGRNYINPVLIPQIISKSNKQLEEEARKKCLRLKKEVTDYVISEKINIGNQRLVISKKNTGAFYVYLYQGIFGGKLGARYGENASVAPLFSQVSDSKFYPDIIFENGKGETYIEVKSSNANANRPWFGKRQINSYFRALIENQHSDMFLAMFRFGDSCKPIKLNKYSTDKLVKKLGSTTRSLLILPHNLLTFLLAISNLHDMDQSSSTNYSNCETYFRPYGLWFSMLREGHSDPQGTINKIIGNYDARISGYIPRITKPKKRTHFGLLNLEDFCFDGLVAEQCTFSDSLYCGDNRIKPFTITKYINTKKEEWRNIFVSGREDFAAHLGLDFCEEYEERMKDENGLQLPDKPRDDIPF